MARYQKKTNHRQHRGFTLVELIITVAIIALLSAVSYAMFYNARNKNDLVTTGKQMASVLRQAQSQSMSDYEGVTWGVHFGNGTGVSSSSFYALFSGSSYAAGTVLGYYKLPATVIYVSSTLAQNASSDIIFGVLSGNASASTSIGIVSTVTNAQSSTISIASSGEVSY